MFTTKKLLSTALMIMVFASAQAFADESLIKILGDNVIQPTADDAMCLNCHASVADNVLNYIHYPAGAGACSYCHSAKPEHLTGTNPPGSVSINKKSENCYTCHERKDNNPVVHSALKVNDESCVSCHNPHGSNTRALLRSESVTALCSTCHNVATEQAKSQHGPVITGQACLNCHTPHSGVNKKLLIRPGKDLCLGCHNQEIKATLNEPRTIPNIQAKLAMANAHPGATGLCTKCHKPHSSDNSRLLKTPYSAQTYNTYNEKVNPYALCFTCHDTAMLKKTDFVTDTAFRNDAKGLNLHWFHVVDAAGSEDKSRGRSCKICHDPHGAVQDHDINATWLMNGNPIKIEYKLVKDAADNAVGGQCAKSCHSTRQYIRANQ